MNQDTKRPLIIFIVIICVVLISYVFWNTKSEKLSGATQEIPNKVTQPSVIPANNILEFSNNASEKLTTEEILLKKADILKMANKGTILTDKQKEEILSLIVGEQIQKYNFTSEERNKLLEALNRE